MAGLARAATIREWATSPFGRYVVGSNAFSFVADRAVVGCVTWGSPTTDDVAWLVDAHRALAPALGKVVHGAYLDVSRIDIVDPRVFAAVAESILRHGRELGTGARRLAVVRRAGPIGAMTEGFFRLLDAPLPFSIQVEPQSALDDLGYAAPAELARELAVIVDELTGTDAMLRDLRHTLDQHPGAVTLAEAARRLGVSERALQRRLKSLRTTFQGEHNDAQMRAAKRLLIDTDAPLTRVALEVGCASLAHFSTLFRRIEGMTPSEWRARHHPSSGS